MSSLLLFVLGCGPEVPATDPVAESTLFRVKVWAGEGVEAEPWREQGVPGVRLYRLAKASRAWGAVVLDDQPVPLQGPAAFRAVLERLDPEVIAEDVLAGLAMLLVEPGPRVAGRVPWLQQEPGDLRAPGQQALAKPPRLVAEELTYWHWDDREAGLIRCRVMLDSLYVACEAGAALVADAGSKEDPIARARRELATSDPAARLAGVHRLARVEGSLASSLLLELVQLDEDPAVRRAAVAALGHLRPPGSGEILGRVLLNDQDPEVRLGAAGVLGVIASEELELPLQIAAKGDPSPAVRMAAASALREVQR